MNDFAKLSHTELKVAISETCDALSKGEKLLRFVAGNHATLGLGKVAEAMPEMMIKLGAELQRLEDELNAKLKA